MKRRVFVIPRFGLHASRYKLTGEFDDYRIRPTVPIASVDAACASSGTYRCLVGHL